MAIQQQRPLTGKVRGVADVVFVLDSSGSMAPVFDGVRDHIGDFVAGAAADPQRAVDWCVALLSAGCQSFRVKDFTSGEADFREAISRFSCDGGDEYTLPALDFASDMSWRSGAHRFIVLLTDEPISGGQAVDYQLRYLDDLMDKLLKCRIQLLAWGPPCPALHRLAGLPKSLYTEMDGHSQPFTSLDFAELMAGIGKTVSASCTGLQGPTAPVPRDLYGLLDGRSPVKPVIRTA